MTYGDTGFRERPETWVGSLKEKCWSFKPKDGIS